MSNFSFKRRSQTLNSFAETTFPLMAIRKHTRETYESAYRCWIAPSLGSHFLHKITRSEIQALLSSASSQTSANILAVMKVLFREALEAGLVDASPVHGIRKPSILVKPRPFLTWSDIVKCDFGKYTEQVRFLALHGLRWSEAVVLTSSDIRDSMIYITRSKHGPTKSKASARLVPLVSSFVAFPRDCRTLRRALAPYGVTIHSLRHTYAYLLKSKGVHVTTAQRLLGHADPKVTLDIYTRVLDHEITDVGDQLKAMFLADTTPPPESCANSHSYKCVTSSK